MKPNLSQQQGNDNSDFLIGDVVVSELDAIIPELFEVSEQPHQSYDEYIMCKPLNHEYKCWLALNEIRHATPSELKARRRLTKAEQAIAEVS